MVTREFFRFLGKRDGRRSGSLVWRGSDDRWFVRLIDLIRSAILNLALSGVAPPPSSAPEWSICRPCICLSEAHMLKGG